MARRLWCVSPDANRVRCALPIGGDDGDLPSDGTCENADCWGDRQTARRSGNSCQRGHELPTDGGDDGVPQRA